MYLQTRCSQAHVDEHCENKRAPKIRNVFFKMGIWVKLLTTWQGLCLNTHTTHPRKNFETEGDGIRAECGCHETDGSLYILTNVFEGRKRCLYWWRLGGIERQMQELLASHNDHRIQLSPFLLTLFCCLPLSLCFFLLPFLCVSGSACFSDGGSLFLRRGLLCCFHALDVFAPLYLRPRTEIRNPLGWGVGPPTF